jgi:pimeloyl-ACP methyl ester carboxylesterase
MQDLRSAMTWTAVEALGVRSLLIAADADLYLPPPLADRVARHFHDAVRVDIARSGTIRVGSVLPNSTAP